MAAGGPARRRRPSRAASCLVASLALLAAALLWRGGGLGPGRRAAGRVPQLTEAAHAVGPQHARIYIAPLPDAYNAGVLAAFDCHIKDFGVTDGRQLLWQPFGEVLEERDGLQLRGSYMYGLEVLMHQQLLESPLRVFHLDDADVVFVPFYASLAFRQSKSSKDKAVMTALIQRFWNRSDALLPALSTKPHFMALGRAERDFIAGCGGPMGWHLYRGWASGFLCHPKAKLVTWLTVEGYTGRHPVNIAATSAHPIHPNSITVPWPGHFHTPSDSPYFRQPFDRQAAFRGKERLAIESFATRFPLREILKRGCAARNHSCLHIEPQGSRFDYNQSQLWAANAASWFCIQPHGDGPTRHVTFDCLAAGAIPLFLDPNLPLMMPFADIIDYRAATAVVPARQIIGAKRGGKGRNLVDLLEKIPVRQRLEALERMHALKHLLLYSTQPEHQHIRFDEMGAVHSRDDAFTGALKALLRSLCARGRLASHRCRTKI